MSKSLKSPIWKISSAGRRRSSLELGRRFGVVRPPLEFWSVLFSPAEDIEVRLVGFAGVGSRSLYINFLRGFTGAKRRLLVTEPLDAPKRDETAVVDAACLKAHFDNVGASLVTTNRFSRSFGGDRGGLDVS